MFVQGILVSPRMVEDHSCLSLQAALKLAQLRCGKPAVTANLGGNYFPPPFIPGDEERGGDAVDEGKSSRVQAASAEDLV